MTNDIEAAARAAFAEWAATEGITDIMFSPVLAVGRTLGNVSGQRDFHLVLLDREWAIWQAALAHATRGEGEEQRGFDSIAEMAHDDAMRATCPSCGDGDRVARSRDFGHGASGQCFDPFHATPPPATGEGFAGLPVAYQSSSIGAPPWDGPATGEAGARGEVAIRRDERERCAKVCEKYATVSRLAAESAIGKTVIVCLRDHEAAATECAAMIRALPASREDDPDPRGVDREAVEAAQSGDVGERQRFLAWWHGDSATDYAAFPGENTKCVAYAAWCGRARALRTAERGEGGR